MKRNHIELFKYTITSLYIELTFLYHDRHKMSKNHLRLRSSSLQTLVIDHIYVFLSTSFENIRTNVSQ